MDTKLDDKTLILLTTLCNLFNLKNGDPKHISDMWDREAKRVQDYRRIQGQN